MLMAAWKYKNMIEEDEIFKIVDVNCTIEYMYK